MTPEALKEFIKFVKERDTIRVRKERGDPWPWTKDPILKAYRFCNIRREDDKQTRLIHENWLRPHAHGQDLWFAMAVARLVNWWPSLNAVGWPLPWEEKVDKFVQELEARSISGVKVFTGAYMVRAGPHVSGLKSTYIALEVLTPMWEDREHIRPRKGDTLMEFHARLLNYKDMGPFIAGQIVADAKFGANSLATAKDRDTWATSGPGSLRGLARLEGLSILGLHNWTRHSNWWASFARFRDAYWMECAKRPSPPPWLDAQNLQNCLCEWDKYQRVKLGQGRPRAGYTPNLGE